MLPVDDALAPLPAGEPHWLRCGELEVALAAGAGGAWRTCVTGAWSGWRIHRRAGGCDRLGLLPDGALGRAHPPWNVLL